MTETAALGLSDDLDEIVQTTNGNLSRLERPYPDAEPSPTSPSLAAAIMDESTGQGFTTAPATSDEDDASDDDDEEEDDSRSNYSIGNHTTNNTNSNMSVMPNGGRAARHYGRLSSGSSGSQGAGGVKGEEKRSHHNVLERKRRDLLKDSFSRLRDSVPTTQPRERVSRAEILRQAADFIASTVQKNASVRAELDELIRKNRELEEKRAKEANSTSIRPAAPAVAASTNSAPVTSSPEKVVDQTETTIKQES